MRKATASTSSSFFVFSRLVFPGLINTFVDWLTNNITLLVDQPTNVLSSDIIVFRGFKLNS